MRTRLCFESTVCKNSAHVLSWQLLLIARQQQIVILLETEKNVFIFCFADGENGFENMIKGYGF